MQTSSALLAILGEIHGSLVSFPHKGQWRGALMFSLIWPWKKRLRKHSGRRWVETPLCPLWRHCNDNNNGYLVIVWRYECSPNGDRTQPIVVNWWVRNIVNGILYKIINQNHHHHSSTSSTTTTTTRTSSTSFSSRRHYHCHSPWWRHQMETFSALLAICAGNSPVPGEFPTQRPVTWSFEVYFDLRPNKWLSKQWWGWWFETISCSLWHHRNDHHYRHCFHHTNLTLYFTRRRYIIGLIFFG